MNAFGQLLFSISHPSAAWYISEYDWNGINADHFAISLPAAFALSLIFCIWTWNHIVELFALHCPECSCIGLHLQLSCSQLQEFHAGAVSLSVCLLCPWTEKLALSLRTIVLNSLRRRLILAHFLNQNLLLFSCDRQGLHDYFFLK